MLFHQQLNDKLWDLNTNDLKPEVADKLKEIADAFIQYLDINEDAIKDVVITGSSASYNYTPHSDLDLHLKVDYEKVHEDCPLVNGYLNSLKKQFNDNHDISIYGVPVEVYAEDINSETVHNGLYSLWQEKWIDIPRKIPPTKNDEAVLAKYNEIKDAANKIEDSEVAEELINKIYEMRKAGLQDVGEFSTENLAFKKLRDNGILERLKQMKKEKIDKQLSLESYNESFKIYESPMSSYRDGTFDEFYNKIISSLLNKDNKTLNQLNKKCFTFNNSKLCIPAHVITHDFKKHNTNLQDWFSLISNFNKPELFVSCKGSKAFDSKYNYAFRYNIDDKFYGLTISKCRLGWMVGTWYQDHPNTILNWLKQSAKTNTSPKVPTATNVPGFPFNERYNNIINYNNKKIKYLNEDKYMNENLDRESEKAINQIRILLKNNGYEINEIVPDGLSKGLWYCLDRYHLVGKPDSDMTYIQGKNYTEILNKLKNKFSSDSINERVDVTDNYIRTRVEEPNTCKKDSFRTKQVNDKGDKIILCKDKDTDKMKLQSKLEKRNESIKEDFYTKTKKLSELLNDIWDKYETVKISWDEAHDNLLDLMKENNLAERDVRWLIGDVKGLHLLGKLSGDEDWDNELLGYTIEDTNESIGEDYEDDDYEDIPEEMHKERYVTYFETQEGRQKYTIYHVYTDSTDDSYNELCDKRDNQLGMYNSYKELKDALKERAEKIATKQGWTVKSIENLGEDDEYYKERNKWESVNEDDSTFQVGDEVEILVTTPHRTGVISKIIAADVYEVEVDKTLGLMARTDRYYTRDLKKLDKNESIKESEELDDVEKHLLLILKDGGTTLQNIQDMFNGGFSDKEISDGLKSLKDKGLIKTSFEGLVTRYYIKDSGNESIKEENNVNITIDDLQNAKYGSSFMDDRATLKIDGREYIKIDKDEWEYHPSLSHAMPISKSTREVYALMQKANEVNLLESTNVKTLYYYCVEDLDLRGDKLNSSEEAYEQAVNDLNKLGFDVKELTDDGEFIVVGKTTGVAYDGVIYSLNPEIDEDLFISKSKKLNMKIDEALFEAHDMINEILDGFDPYETLTATIQNGREIIRVSVYYTNPQDKALMHTIKCEFLDEAGDVIDETLDEALTTYDVIKILEYLFKTHKVIDQ